MLSEALLLTVCISPADVLPLNVASPLPAVSVEVVNVAVLTLPTGESVTVPSVVEPSLNATVPVGVPEPLACSEGHSLSESARVRRRGQRRICRGGALYHLGDCIALAAGEGAVAAIGGLDVMGAHRGERGGDGGNAAAQCRSADWACVAKIDEVDSAG